ncbi:ATP-binding cassette domain-containing protein [Candidatus Woesearchaeota archaeon]|jgi:ABC-2 type transport system ATP-binding protein|nr:ATP-binding cassette domain-containing protein [Candidatus Woesearchaeota archaeon]MBT6518354.1 ATP-binding cassette domain-containing protein [Candidatus Woesearchaeota archaeon]MBT7366651.1 ATP-binding cassette domain-containing protein [Candidatus Woesearchaeota archaeon]
MPPKNKKQKINQKKKQKTTIAAENQSSDALIKVDSLRKVYKTHHREEGLWNAVKSLFHRVYENKEALKGISFNIDQGEIVGLIGPNGAGKSTTIKTLSGVLYPTSGDVKVCSFTPWKDRVKYVENIGVVFGQKPQLMWDLPPVDSFALNKELYDIPPKVFEKRLKYMTKLLRITDITTTPVRDLSLGERMKAKIVNALLHNPKLVFLDEPSIGLDVIAKDLLRDFILDVNKRYKTTFIITTHDMQDIEKLCKRVIIINHGIIVYDGPLDHIKKYYLKSKIIHVKAEDKINGFSMKGCKILEQDTYEIKIEVDIKTTPIKKVIVYLLKKFECADLIIEDPPIEQVIQRIFNEKKQKKIME